MKTPACPLDELCFLLYEKCEGLLLICNKAYTPHAHISYPTGAFYNSNIKAIEEPARGR